MLHGLQVPEVLALEPVTLLIVQIGRVEASIQKDQRVFIELIWRTRLWDVAVREVSHRPSGYQASNLV